VLDSLIFLHHLTFLSTPAQVGQILESGLEESYLSLTNVELPSWDHADGAAYARMLKGP